MNASTIVLVTLLVLIAALVVMLVTTVGSRAVRLRRRRERERIRDEIRPGIVAVLASPDEPQPLVLPTERPAEALFEVLAFDYLAKVRGESRDALVGVLVARGTVTAAERRAGRRGVVGRLSALELLGRCGLARSRTAIEPVLRDRSPDARASAVRALGRLGTADVVPALLGALDGARPVSAALVAQALQRVGPQAQGQLTAALGNPSDAVRSVAATVLGLEQAVAAVPALIDVLAHDPVDLVRGHAARALGRIGDPRATAPLIALTHVPALTQPAAAALGEVGDPRAVAGLVELVGSPSHDVAMAGALGLVGCGAAGREALRRLRDSPDERSARYALGALARAVVAGGGDPATSPELVAAGHRGAIAESDDGAGPGPLGEGRP